MNRSEALTLITKFSAEEFIEKTAFLKLPKNRARQFFEVIKGEQSIYYCDKFDIEEYALKIIFPEIYGIIKTIKHINSTSEIYEFDPAKNGQNIIKHGLGFGEIVTYSTKFGTLSVPCPDIHDTRRAIIFSDLVLGEKEKLSFPLSQVSGIKYTLSVAQQIDGKFRFISSRFMSSKKKKYTENVKQSIRGFVFPDENSKDSFVSRCIEKIEVDLLRTSE